MMYREWARLVVLAGVFALLAVQCNHRSECYYECRPRGASEEACARMCDLWPGWP